MTKELVFITGTMGSAKTMDLLAVRHEYINKPNSGYKVTLVATDTDTRNGKGTVSSRAGLEAQADIILPRDKRIQDLVKFREFSLNLVLVDEAQFLSKLNVESLRALVDDDAFDTSVLAYGLRTDYMGELFEGSKRLLELADHIDSRRSVCSYCEKYALFNLRIGSLEGGQIVLGSEDTYAPVCSTCYTAEMGEHGD